MNDNEFQGNTISTLYHYISYTKYSMFQVVYRGTLGLSSMLSDIQVTMCCLPAFVLTNELLEDD